MVYVSNSFTWCIGGDPLGLEPPPAVRGVVLSLTLPDPRWQTITTVTTVLGGEPLKFAPSQTQEGEWLIELPNFDQFIGVLVKH